MSIAVLLLVASYLGPDSVDYPVYAAYFGISSDGGTSGPVGLPRGAGRVICESAPAHGRSPVPYPVPDCSAYARSVDDISAQLNEARSERMQCPEPARTSDWCTMIPFVAGMLAMSAVAWLGWVRADRDGYERGYRAAQKFAEEELGRMAREKTP